mgnify:CR=1 FL=1
MFGYTMIKKDRLAHLEQCEAVQNNVLGCYLWFRGWNDLSILLDFILDTSDSDTLNKFRPLYANARGTDVYGGPLKPTKKVNIPKKNAGRKLAARLKAETSGKSGNPVK